MALPIHTRIQKLRQFPPGRARQAASNVERIAFPLGFHILLPHTRAVTEAARAYVHMRTLRFGERSARGGGEAAKIDRAVDVRVAFIYDAARRSAADLPGTAEGRAGERILQGYFPQGLKPVVSAPFEEELIQVEALIEGLRGELADDAALLTIERHIVAIEALLPRYAEALDKRRRVTARDLRAAWLAVHHAVLELAFAVVVFVPDAAQQATIIGPIFEQDDRLATLYARRQKGQPMDAVDLDEAAFDGDGDEPAEDDGALIDEADDVPFDGGEGGAGGAGGAADAAADAAADGADGPGAEVDGPDRLAPLPRG